MSETQKTRPTTKAEAIIWNRYNHHRMWDWIPITSWPTDLSKAVITRTLGYTTRFRLFVYFVGNGMDPKNARDTIKDMVDSYAAKQHIDYLYKDLDRNKKKWTYWDERMQKITVLDDTEVWSMPLPRRRWHNSVTVQNWDNDYSGIRWHNSAKDRQRELFDSEDELSD